MSRLWLVIGLLVVVATEGQAADQTLRLAIGQSATIELQENPSTGYRWVVDTKTSSNLSILHIDDRGFSRNAANSHLLGAPGVHRWSVKAESPGSASITFVYGRPWEASVARRHQVAVEARR
jgi:inhibitor of cysteine peptidase